jgi:hypothetical protein
VFDGQGPNFEQRDVPPMGTNPPPRKVAIDGPRRMCMPAGI